VRRSLDAKPRSAEPDPGLPQPAGATGQQWDHCQVPTLAADHAAAHATSCVALDVHIPSFAAIRAGERGDGSREPILDRAFRAPVGRAGKLAMAKHLTQLHPEEEVAPQAPLVRCRLEQIGEHRPVRLQRSQGGAGGEVAERWQQRAATKSAATRKQKCSAGMNWAVPPGGSDKPVIAWSAASRRASRPRARVPVASPAAFASATSVFEAVTGRTRGSQHHVKGRLRYVLS
jgi:hypothetical protein